MSDAADPRGVGLIATTNAATVACLRTFLPLGGEEGGWSGREGGRLPGASVVLGARPLLFLDGHPSSSDAAMVTQTGDFKQAEQNRVREPAGDGIYQNKIGVPADTGGDSPSACTCTGTHVGVFREPGEMDISVRSKQRVSEPPPTPAPYPNTRQHLFGYLHLHAPLAAGR